MEKVRQRGRVLRVLVIDNSEESPESPAVLLGLMGHQIEVAHTDSEALRKAHMVPPDVVLAAIQLPEMDGYETVRRIRELPLPRKPLFVALTARARSADYVRSQNEGFAYHFIKPVDPVLLLTVLRAYGQFLDWQETHAASALPGV
jgi:CheY-like chemotaxis protein